MANDTLTERLMAAQRERANSSFDEKKEAVVRLLKHLCTKTCNAGGYDKSILRAALLSLPEDSEWREELLGFEEEIGLLVQEVAEHFGYLYEPKDYYIACHCNQHCREW